MNEILKIFEKRIQKNENNIWDVIVIGGGHRNDGGRKSGGNEPVLFCVGKSNTRKRNCF